MFRARDTKLERDVALKLLPEHFADDPDRLSRFRREAQVLASLNHPNIAQIYGFEDSGSTHCIVMELVDGETLHEHLARGPMTVEDAVPIARQVAEALEAAHERGIMHRDLKPANIKLTPDGKVKVLDFGLAKTYDATNTPQNPSNSPTLSAAQTMGGVIFGTVAVETAVTSLAPSLAMPPASYLPPTMKPETFCRNSSGMRRWQANSIGRSATR